MRLLRYLFALTFIVSLASCEDEFVLRTNPDDDDDPIINPPPPPSEEEDEATVVLDSLRC